MTGKDAFRIWASAGARWVDWVRPVPFAAMDGSHSLISAANFTIPKIEYMESQENTAVIVDLPDYNGVKEGIALAGMGFRPIPLYNGTKAQEGAMALVNTHSIEAALIWGARELERITIPKNAPPAFLLDSNRTHRYKMHASLFDNSWDLYAQDLPSAEYLFTHGVDRIIVRGDMVQKDVAKILYPFQKQGLAVFFTNGYHHPKGVTIRRPRRRRHPG